MLLCDNIINDSIMKVYMNIYIYLYKRMILLILILLIQIVINMSHKLFL